MKSLLIIFALLAVVALLCSCAARQQPAYKPVVILPTTIVQQMEASRQLAAISLPPASTNYLTWDGAADLWRVYMGAARGSWSSNTLISQRRIQMARATYYGVAAVAPDGTESTLAYWPSNAVFNTYLQVADNVRPDIWRESLWLTWTNHVEGPPQQFLRTRTVQTGWQ